MQSARLRNTCTIQGICIDNCYRRFYTAIRSWNIRQEMYYSSNLDMKVPFISLCEPSLFR